MRILILALILSGCSAQQRFDVPVKVVAATMLFYDTRDEVGRICGDYSKVGCMYCKGNNLLKECLIHSLKERCVFDHEMDHVFFGDFHKGGEATCKERAN